MAQTAPYDPRPRGVTENGLTKVEGWRCTQCAYPIAQPVQRCPECGGEMGSDVFGPSGTIAASTVLRVRVPGYDPPYAVAYLDLDDGPRVLVHTPGTSAIPPGTAAGLTGSTERGDLAADIQEGTLA